MERYPVLTEQWPRGVEMRALAIRYRALPTVQTPDLARFGEGLRLLRAESDAYVTARDNVYHPPSGWVHVALQWQRIGSAGLAGLHVRLRVTDNIGQVWGDRLERASEVWRLYPPDRWQADEIVGDAYDVNMNPAAPPGRYKIELQVLDGNGRALPVRIGNETTDRYVVRDIDVRQSGGRLFTIVVDAPNQGAKPCARHPSG
jgi:hypothetical protein